MAKKDINQLAKFVAEIATSESEDTSKENKSKGATKGRLGGLIGGKARAASLTSKQRSVIAKKAAQARWNKTKDN